MQEAQEAASKPGASKIIKWLVIGGAVSFLAALIILAAAAVFIEHWIKKGDVKTVLIYLAGAATGGDVRVKSIVVGENGKITIQGLSINKPGSYQFTADNIETALDLDSLMLWKINVPVFNMNRPRITLAASEAAPSKAKPESPPATRGISLSPIKSPIFINLGSMAINDMSLERNSGAGKVQISGLYLYAKGKVGPDGADGSVSLVTSDEAVILSGSADDMVETIPRVIITANLSKGGEVAVRGDMDFSSKGSGKNPIPSPIRLKGSFKAAGEINGIPTGTASAFLSLDKDQLMDITASAEESGQSLKYDIKSRKIKVNLDRISRIVSIPGAWVNGVLDVTSFDVKGTAPVDARISPETSVSGEIRAKLYYATYGTFNLPEGGSFDMKLEDFKMTGSGYSGKIKGGMSAQKIIYNDIAASAAYGKLDADFSGVSADATTGGVNGSAFVSELKSRDAKLDGLNFTIKAKGDFVKGNLNEISATAISQEGAWARVSGNAAGYSADSLNLKATLHLPMDKFKSGWIAKDASFYFTDGVTDAVVLVEGKTGHDFKETRVGFNGYVNLTGVEGSTGDRSAGILSTTGQLRFKGRVNPLLDITDIDAQGQLRSSGIEVADSFTATPVTISVSVASPDLVNDKIALKCSMNAYRVLPARGAKEGFREFPAFFDLVMESDPVIGKYVIKTGLARLGPSSFRAQGWLDGKNMNFKGDVAAERADLKTLFRLMPPAARKAIGVQKLEGTLRMAALWEGKLPRAADDISWPPPFELSGDMVLSDGGISSKSMGFSAEGATANISASIDKSGLKLSGLTKVKKFADKDLIGDAIADPSADFDIRYVNNEKLEVNKLTVSAPAIGLSESMKGSIGGFTANAWKDISDKPGKVLPNLAMNIENKFSLALEKGTFLAGADFHGGVKMDVSVKSAPKKNIAISGITEFSNLSVAMDGKKVIQRLNGRLPMSKTLVFAKEGAKAEIASGAQADTVQPPKSVRETSFYDSLRGGDAGRDSFTVDYVNAGPLLMSNAVFDLRLSGNTLGIDYLRATLLGGSITGAYQVKGEGGEFVMRASQVFTGVNIERILKSDLGLSSKDAELDGATDLTLTIRADDEERGVDITKVDAAVNITKIGPKALDKLLLFIDPQESSPAVMNVRTLLNYAKPEKVELLTKHGNLSLTVDLSYSPALGGQTVVMPVIKRAPMHNLVNFTPLREKLEEMSFITSFMRLVGSGYIVTTQDQQLALR